MIGTQPTGAIEGVDISAVAHEGLRVTVDGKPARFAIIDDDGKVIVDSVLLAREIEAVAINMYRNLWKGLGHLRVHSKPLKP